MIAVRVMQMTVGEIVRVIAVRDRLVSATRAVMVLGRVTIVEVGRATRGIRGADVDPMLLDAASLLVLQMTLLEIVHVTIVLNRAVSARGAMDVLLSW
ncbi:MAG TPA: hypothetical protein VGG84_06660 [Gemmatimonadaceae bacterium]